MSSSLIERREHVVAGRYHVERVLGEGGMGVVYRVRDAATGQWLALKQLRGAQTGPQAASFEREYRTLASLRHRRIVQVYEYGADDSGPFYTMELLEGSDLSARAPLPWRETCACLRDAASILGVLHARRLVHRDLSPRNLWLTPDGRLKLLDFGAAAPFGPSTEIVGTPPFVAPEALHGRGLDARCDLFALGALGYWLLTSTHAFGATSLDELPEHWEKAPPAPSSLAKLVAGGAKDIPPALDQLILSLLRVEPDERPESTGDLVDQLNALADLALEAEEVVVMAYLESSVFVAREHEQDQFAAALAHANLGTPQALSIEGPEGIGRTRLLSELATSARVAGATVVTASVGAGGRPYEAASSLLRALVTALPEEARRAAQPYLSVLGPLAPALVSDRSSRHPPVVRDAADDRARKQTALGSWFSALSRERTLVIILDDLDAADEESQALLAALAHAAKGDRLLLIGAVRSDHAEAHQATLRGFRTSARVLPLPPLALPEVREMLRSVFGEVRYLERLAVRLHKISGGSPSHTLMLARHLVRSGAARYAEGSWTLPAELPTDLPSTLGASLLLALEALSPEARALARLASVSQHGPLTLAMLRALGGSPDAITSLVEQHLLRATDDGFVLAFAEQRQTLLSELSAAQRATAHRVLADQLSESDEVLSLVRAALHRLHAGEHRVGLAGLLRVSRRVIAGEHEQLRSAVPLFAEALDLVRASEHDPRTTIPLLSVLAIAGYQVDRTYAARYGDDALRALQGALHFSLAKRLRPVLGKLLSLLVALLVTTLVLRVRRSKLRTIELATWLSTVAGFLMGPASLCLDRAKLRHYAEVLEPLLGLGPDHAVSQIYRFCLGLGLTIEDHCAAAPRQLAVVIDRLNQPRPISGLPEKNRQNLLASALYSYGLRETFACDPHLLVTAETLQAFSAMHAMQADQLRWLYYSHRGETALAEGYEQGLELKAIQQGTAWQAELLMPRHQARIALWTHDAAQNRRASVALTRLAAELPSCEVYARRARAVDLYLRGNLEQALPLLEVDEEPLARLGWTSMRALLAHVYSARGRHQEARSVCVDALARLTVDDLRYVIMSLPIEVELALADAHLGSLAEADARLASLLEAHADKGAIVLGLLLRARTQVALLRGDFASAEQHLEQVDAWYRPTRLQSLFRLGADLRAELRRARGLSSVTRAGSRLQAPDRRTPTLSDDDGHLLTRVKLMMTSRRGDNDGRAEAALLVALELTGADTGFLVCPDGAVRSVKLEEHPSDELVGWARTRLLDAGEEDERTVSSHEVEPARDGVYLDGLHHRIAILRKLSGHVDRPVAALVLGAPDAPPAIPSSAVLRVIGERL